MKNKENATDGNGNDDSQSEPPQFAYFAELPTRLHSRIKVPWPLEDSARVRSRARKNIICYHIDEPFALGKGRKAMENGNYTIQWGHKESPHSTFPLFRSPLT